MQPSTGSQATGTALVANAGFDWNNAAEQSIAALLGQAPAVGPLLSALVFIFWPASKEDIWAQIEKQVEQLVNQAFDKFAQTLVRASLQGLNDNLNSYLTALESGKDDPQFVGGIWSTVNQIFVNQRSTFQLEGYELLLLPLYAQFANMHLSLLRDGVLGGPAWGFSPSLVQQYRTDLTKTIEKYTSHVQNTYNDGLKLIESKIPSNDPAQVRFRKTNTYVRQMTLTVLDFKDLWEYFDVSKYPHGKTVHLGREVYSDPQGTCGNPIVLPSYPAQPIEQITVWGFDRIDAAQLTYPAGGGPGGVTVTRRMGNANGGSNVPPNGGVFPVARHNPVVTVGGNSGDILSALSFTFEDGKSTGQLAKNIPGGPAFSWSIANEVLSSIFIQGESRFYRSADCAVFGFQFRREQPVSAELQRLLYVTAPELPEGARLSAGPAAVAARDSYWNYLASQVKR
jgi:hypothetical protein